MGVVLGVQLKTVSFFLVVALITLSFFYADTRRAEAATIIRPPNNLGLVGYWSFDEGRGTHVSDLSGNGNDGLFLNSPTWVMGKSKGALAFDGVDDYIEISNSTTLQNTPSNEWSMSAWVYPTGAGGNRIIVRKDASGGGYYMRMNGTNFQSLLRFSGGHIERSAGTVILNEWNHFVVTYDGTTRKHFLDGVEVGSWNESATLAFNTSVVRIGANSSTSEFFNGRIDDVRIYNRVLSDTEVQSLYVNTRSTVVGITPVDRYNDGLVGHWTFDGKHTTATTVEDIAGDNDGTISGDVSPVIGIIGQALEFGGGTSVVNVSPVPQITTNAITVSAWFKTNSLGFSQAVVRKNGLSGTNYDYVLRIHETSNMIAWAAGKVTGNISGVEGFTVTPGVWYHVVGIKTDSGNHSLYVNGNLVSTSARTSAVTSGESLYLGGTGLSSIDGSVDDVRIYNRALSANEVAGLYSTTSSSKMRSSTNELVTSGLIGHWSFDANTVSGSSVSDVSGNQSNGTIVGDTNIAVGKIGEALNFDGDGDYVTLPTLTSARSLSLWVYIDSGQIGWKYLLDARTGLANGYFASLGIGSNWATLYVNGTSQTVNWANIPQDQWVHLYIESNITFTDNINLMSRYSNNENLAGMLDDVRIYNRALTEAEITQLYSMGQ